jgi:hypothetical protein
LNWPKWFGKLTTLSKVEGQIQISNDRMSKTNPLLAILAMVEVLDI